jgi:hypothetical protein
MSDSRVEGLTNVNALSVTPKHGANENALFLSGAGKISGERKNKCPRKTLIEYPLGSFVSTQRGAADPSL